MLEDLRERVQSVRTRGGQLAGFAGANVDSVLGALHGAARDMAGGALLVGFFLHVLSLVTVLRGTVLPGSILTVSAKEVAKSREP